MHVKLPAVLGVDAKSRLGRVRQIAEPPTRIDCSVVKYTPGKSVGHVFQSTAGANLVRNVGRDVGRKQKRGARPRVCLIVGGADGTRTRDPRRDRPVF
jgi:hypothetical protein